MRYAYPYQLAPQPEGGFTVTFPDVPEAVMQGDSEQEAASMAQDALVTALSFYTEGGERLPRPSPARKRPVAYVPPLAAAKLALHEAMIAAGVSTIPAQAGDEPARRLRVVVFGGHPDDPESRAGGLIATIATLVLIGWIGWRGAFPGALLLLALIVMIGGSLLVARRRWPTVIS